jgi:hypothetical protein
MNWPQIDFVHRRESTYGFCGGIDVVKISNVLETAKITIERFQNKSSG